jgi:hypothetical protein
MTGSEAACRQNLVATFRLPGEKTAAAARLPPCPLGTAHAPSPFGEKAGAASASLLGFWQMMNAAVGV